MPQHSPCNRNIILLYSSTLFLVLTNTFHILQAAARLLESLLDKYSTEGDYDALLTRYRKVRSLVASVAKILA